MKIQSTKDGSHTLYIEELDETYHSTHGAIQEARHVFIENGIKLIYKSTVSVLEVGFGTGLNAILTQSYAENNQITVAYSGLETVPLNIDIIGKLNYVQELQNIQTDIFNDIHQVDWNSYQNISKHFKLNKIKSSIQEYEAKEKFDVIYYDAFGPRAQIEMWDIAIFEKLYGFLNTDGILVTYCAMGQFKRDLKTCGFEVKSVPGPPGKREMTIAIKN
ncbi:MAG: tRNA (5-methylaminomethyl-2-thiouridine)(34)-methyltransferase MnmD [Flavobacteriales bacterium]